MNQKTPMNVAPKQLKKWLDEDNVKPILIDVREHEELEVASLNYKILHFPLSDSLNWSTNFESNLSFDKKIVVICHSGIRSWNFGVWLLEQDSRYQVWNLTGGIDAWSLEVDNLLPRY